jgi:hypothetical protein
MDIKNFMEIEKTSFQIIKFYIKFYMNKINQSESDALTNYKGDNWYTDINYYLINNKFRFDNYFYYNSSPNNKTLTDEQKHIKSQLKKYYKILFYIKEIDNVFRKIPKYDKNIMVYRGISGKNQELKNMIYLLETAKIGSTFVFPTYVSTSLNINTAIHFSSKCLYKSQMNMTKNIRLNDRIDIGYNDIYKLFGEKKFFLMKINIPKGNKFMYLEHFNKHGKNILIESWEHEVLLARNCKMKLTKKYDELFPQTLQSIHRSESIKHKITNIIKDKIKYITTRVYEFEYEGYEDKELIIPVIESVDIKKYLTKPENRAISVQVKDDIIKEMEKLQKKQMKTIFKVENAKPVK